MHDGYWYKSGAGGLIARTLLRLFQFITALVVLILYALDLRDIPSARNSQWIYAEVVAVLSIMTVICHLFFTVTRYMWYTWDWVLAVLWAALLGVFMSMHTKDTGGQDVQPASGRARVAQWFDLIGMILWLCTAILGFAWCCGTRKMKRRIEQDHAKVEETEMGRVTL